MLNREKLTEELSELPLYFFDFIDPAALEFTDRVRWICQHECPMYGKTWACPPAVGSVAECEAKCRTFENCLMIATIVEVNDIASIDETLSTREPHEMLTNQVRDRMRAHGADPFILSTEACSHCAHCAYLEGQPCRFPEKMHPCVESHGINVLPLIEQYGLSFQYGENVVTWFSLLFFGD